MSLPELEEGVYMVRFVYLDTQNETCVDWQNIYVCNRADMDEYIKKEREFKQAQGHTVLKINTKLQQ